MNRKKQTKRRCKSCGKPERIRSVGGTRFSNISPHLGICANCITAASRG